MSNALETGHYFVTSLSYVSKPEFLANATVVYDEAVAEQQKLDTGSRDNTIAIQTTDFSTDQRISELTNYIVQTAYNILHTQGYKVDDKVTYFHSMWGQYHEKYSAMPEHVHNDGVQIAGFYFLQCPENGSKMMVHDPRYGKRMVNLPEADPNKVTEATGSLVFTPSAGDMFFTNSWLPHSFSINRSDEAFKLIHFNVSVTQAPVKEAIVV